MERLFVVEGAILYRMGKLGISTTVEGQFWTVKNPIKFGSKYAQEYGIPSKNVNFDFIVSGKLSPGSNFITRKAPSVGQNFGGAIEAVTEANSICPQFFKSMKLVNQVTENRNMLAQYFKFNNMVKKVTSNDLVQGITIISEETTNCENKKKPK